MPLYLPLSPEYSIMAVYNFVENSQRYIIRRLRCTTGVVDTGGKFATGVFDTGDAWTCEYLRELLKKFAMNLTLFSGPWGKMTLSL